MRKDLNCPIIDVSLKHVLILIVILVKLENLNYALTANLDTYLVLLELAMRYQLVVIHLSSIKLLKAVAVLKEHTSKALPVRLVVLIANLARLRPVSHVSMDTTHQGQLVQCVFQTV